MSQDRAEPEAGNRAMKHLLLCGCICLSLKQEVTVPEGGMLRLQLAVPLRRASAKPSVSQREPTRTEGVVAAEMARSNQGAFPN